MTTETTPGGARERVRVYGTSDSLLPLVDVTGDYEDTDVIVDADGDLRVILPGRTLVFARGTWSRSDAVALEEAEVVELDVAELGRLLRETVAELDDPPTPPRHDDAWFVATTDGHARRLLARGVRVPA